MKSKYVFLILFTILLSVMSIAVVGEYSNVQIYVASQIDYEGTIKRELQYFTLGVAERMDYSYKLLRFDDLVESDVEYEIEEVVNERVNRSLINLGNDENFIFSIRNTATGKEITNNIDLLDDDLAVYIKLVYDENGNLLTENSSISNGFQSFDALDLFERYIYSYSTSELVYRELVSIQNPANLEIIYAIPTSLAPYGYLYQILNNKENYGDFMLIVMMIALVILSIFIIVYPISIMEEVNPFKTIKNWKGEFVILLLGTSIMFSVMACVFFGGYTLTGEMGTLLAPYDVSYPMILGVNVSIWFINFELFAIALFYVKYMIVHGPIRYLRDDTCVGSFIKWCKRKVDALAEFDLSSPIHKKIMWFCAFNCFVLLFVAFGPFGFVLIIIYAILLFLWIKGHSDKIQNDYMKLLDATERLGNGDFNAEINEDIGVFNSLKDAFNNIRIGFEKAVDEEVKSQNMKTELISNVSHDLKTPLTCIKNYIVLLQDENITEEQRKEYLSNLNQYANRLTTLIEDLFEVSKVNSGNIQLELMPLNIKELIDQVQIETEDILEAKNLQVIKHYADTDISLLLDSNKTYRIFENLFTNIGKYALANSRVYIDIVDTESNVVIEFKNISESQMNFSADEIVERFVRGDKSRHESGSGLGLAIIKSFTEVQGGSFTIHIDGDLFKTIISFPKNHEKIADNL